MDGYSVHDAASVLGVPEARVWELIARGILTGSPEADGAMRVFLKASPSAPPQAQASDTPRNNGNGGGYEGGLNPFRELLTEFRNLTERYGQALLALGEARGEVASLRSRVDVLEARVDLRLPGPRRTSTVAWELPDLPVPETPSDVARPEAAPPSGEPSGATAPEAASGATPPEAAAEHVEPSAEATETAEAPVPEQPPLTTAEPGAEQAAEAPRRRRNVPFVTTAEIARALARAEDPTLADLPGAREAAEAMAALERDMATPGATAPVVPPDEPMPAEEMLVEPESPPAAPLDTLVAPEPSAAAAEPPEPVAEPPEPSAAAAEPPEPVAEPAPPPEATPPSQASPYTTDVVEPDWFADGDFSWLEAAQAEAERSQEQPTAPAEQVEAQLPVEGELVEDAQPEAGEPEVLETDAAAAIADELPFEPAEAAMTTVSPPAPSEQPASEPDAAEPAPTAASSAAPVPHEDEEELMRLGDEFEEADLEMSPSGWHDERRSSPASPTSPAPPQPATRELSDAELARLADDQGWDTDEVQAIRSFLGRPAGGGDPEPGAVEIEPMTDAPHQPPDATQVPAGASGPDTGEMPAIDDEADTDTSGSAETSAAPDIPGVPGFRVDRDWLRGRRGPAATAYRRLRRLFP